MEKTIYVEQNLLNLNAAKNIIGLHLIKKIKCVDLYISICEHFIFNLYLNPSFCTQHNTYKSNTEQSIYIIWISRFMNLGFFLTFNPKIKAFWSFTEIPYPYPKLLHQRKIHQYCRNCNNKIHHVGIGLFGLPAIKTVVVKLVNGVFWSRI